MLVVDSILDAKLFARQESQVCSVCRQGVTGLYRIAMASSSFVDGVIMDAHTGPMRNIGNSCFINAALQSIFAPQAVKRMLRALGGSSPGLGRTYAQALDCSSKSFIPKDFTDDNTLYVGNQEDAHEFVTKVLGRETHNANQSTFQSFDHPSLQCATCGVLTTSQLAGYDVLSLPVCTPLGACITSVQSAMDAYLAPEEGVFLRCGSHACACSDRFFYQDTLNCPVPRDSRSPLGAVGGTRPSFGTPCAS